MAESLNMILPEELIIEILSRVESSNPQELRCVCKLWKSLVFDIQFLENHLLRAFTEIAVLLVTAFEKLKSFKSLQEEEEDDEEAVDEEDDEDAEEEEEEDGDDDDDDEEEDDNNDDDDEDYDDDFDDDDDDVEGEDVEEEEPVMDVIDKIRQEKEVAPLDNLLKILRYLKGKFETIRDDIQAVEDRVKCLQNFLLVYLKSAKSSSSS